MMCARSRLDADKAGWRFGKESQKVQAIQSLAQYRLVALIHALDLEDGLRDVEADHCRVHPLPSVIRKPPRPILTVRTEAIHAIKWAVQRARCMTLETVAPMGDDAVISLPAVAS